MDTLLLLKFATVFVFVIALMMLFSWFLKKLGLGTGSVREGGRQRRLKVVEFLQVDHKRRLVLVKRDDREHLLILGPEGETVVETNIPAEGDAPQVVAFARDQRNVKI